MTLNQFKDVCRDYDRAHRWAQTVHGTQGRVVGIGRTWIRLMHGDGRITKVRPQQITKAW